MKIKDSVHAEALRLALELHLVIVLPDTMSRLFLGGKRNAFGTMVADLARQINAIVSDVFTIVMTPKLLCQKDSAVAQAATPLMDALAHFGPIAELAVATYGSVVDDDKPRVLRGLARDGELQLGVVLTQFIFAAATDYPNPTT